MINRAKNNREHYNYVMDSGVNIEFNLDKDNRVMKEEFIVLLQTVIVDLQAELDETKEEIKQ